MSSIPLTDWANGTRFADQYRHDAFYVPEMAQWFTWDHQENPAGALWRADLAGRRYRMAAQVARAIALEGPGAETEALRREIYRHALRSESADGLDRMLRCASRDARVVVGPDRLDANPWLFNAANGTVNLKTGELGFANSENLITRISPVLFEPGAPCPTWEAFLRRITGGNSRLEGFIRRAAGYSLTGDVGEHVLFLLYGAGANGKSTLLEVLLHVLGTYGKAAAHGLLIQHREGRHEEELADLRGVRFATCVESGVDQAFDEPRLKQITGGDTISARHLFQHRFSFAPSHKLWVATNHRPRVRGGDEGIWRRLKLVPFEQVIAPEERDPNLKAKLLQEAPGILSWAVLGCLEWQREGLGIPDEVRDATEDYRDSEDRIGPFLEERCVTGPAKRVVSSRIYEVYRGWAEASGSRPMSQQAFTEALEVRGYHRVRTSVARMWEGLALRDVSSDGVTDPEPISASFSPFSLVKGVCPE